jgi:hypothetical protein
MASGGGGPTAQRWSVAEQCTWDGSSSSGRQSRCEARCVRPLASLRGASCCSRYRRQCVADRAKTHMHSAELRRRRRLHRLTGLAAATMTPKTAGMSMYAAEPLLRKRGKKGVASSRSLSVASGHQRLPHRMAPAHSSRCMELPPDSIPRCGLSKAPKQSRARSGARGVGDPSAISESEHVLPD